MYLTGEIDWFETVCKLLSLSGNSECAFIRASCTLGCPRQVAVHRRVCESGNTGVTILSGGVGGGGPKVTKWHRLDYH